MHVYLSFLTTFQHAADGTSRMLHDMCMHMTTNLSWLTMAILVSVSPSGASAVIFFLGGMIPLLAPRSATLVGSRQVTQELDATR